MEINNDISWKLQEFIDFNEYIINRVSQAYGIPKKYLTGENLNGTHNNKIERKNNIC
jgi:hypothetical protein